MLRGFWEELNRRGVSFDALERASGVSCPRSGDVLSTLPEQHMHRVFEAGLALTQEDTLGLSVGRAIGVASLHLVGHIALGSKSLAQAVDLITRAQPQVGRRSPLLTDSSDGRLRLGFRRSDARASAGARIEAQLTAVLLHDVALHFFSSSARERPGVQFPFPAPSDLPAYQRFFPGPLEFDTEGTFVTFSRHCLVRRRSGADAILLQQLFELARNQFGTTSMDDDWTCRVRRALHAHNAPRLLDGSVLAGQLGLSLRGLTRRLALEGTSLSALLDEVLYERAKVLLQRPGTSATQVAEALGYAELSSFFRAFRRWSEGLTPSAYRRGLTQRTR